MYYKHSTLFGLNNIKQKAFKWFYNGFLFSFASMSVNVWVCLLVLVRLMLIINLFVCFCIYFIRIGSFVVAWIVSSFHFVLFSLLEIGFRFDCDFRLKILFWLFVWQTNAIIYSSSIWWEIEIVMPQVLFKCDRCDGFDVDFMWFCFFFFFLYDKSYYML